MCNNTPGSFSCACNTGWTGNGTSCAGRPTQLTVKTFSTLNFAFEIKCHIRGNSCTLDVDECTLNLDDCHDQAMCTNTPGSYSCACNTGGTGNGTNCQGTPAKLIRLNIFCVKLACAIDCNISVNFSASDVDECMLNLDDCHVQAMCNNTPSSFSCSCNIGWMGNGSICEGTSKKLIVAKISLLNFAYAIDSNIKGNSFTSDIDECTLNLHYCDEQAMCNNTLGSFSCSCNTGWTGNGSSCEGTPTT